MSLNVGHKISPTSSSAYVLKDWIPDQYFFVMSQITLAGCAHPISCLMSTENILHFEQMIVKTAFCCHSHARSSICTVKLKCSTEGPRRETHFWLESPLISLMVLQCFYDSWWSFDVKWIRRSVLCSRTLFFAAGHIKALQLIFLKLHLLIFDHLGAVLSTVIDTALTYYHLLKVLFVRKSWFLTLIPTSLNTGPSMSVLTCWDETQRSTFLTNVTLI